MVVGFVLANNIPEFPERIRCIFLSATPHRASDRAAVLNNILTISGIMSSRQNMTDITTGSTLAQIINEDFGKHGSSLPIFSFFETLQIKLGISSSLIVEKSLVILGRTLCSCSLKSECLTNSLMVPQLTDSVLDEKEFSTSMQIIGIFANSIVPMIATTCH